MSAAKIPRVQRSVLESCIEWDLVTFNSLNPLVVVDSLTSEQTTNSPMLHTICSHSITQDMMSAFQLYTSIVCIGRQNSSNEHVKLVCHLIVSIVEPRLLSAGDMAHGDNTTPDPTQNHPLTHIAQHRLSTYSEICTLAPGIFSWRGWNRHVS